MRMTEGVTPDVPRLRVAEGGIGFLCCIAVCFFVSGCTGTPNGSSIDPQTKSSDAADSGASGISRSLHDCTEHMKLLYATQFSVDYYDGGYASVSIADGQRFLIVPEEQAIPKDLARDVVVIPQNPGMVYLASSSCMDFWRELNALDRIPFTSTRQIDWDLSSVRRLMEDGQLEYVGKYSNVDYEYLVAEGCDLAVENAMIYHSPETLEKLQSLGIPVIVERSSFEPEPLGRLEWIRLWGVVTGHRDQADAFFKKQAKKVQRLSGTVGTDHRPSVMVFSVNANGVIRVPTPDSYTASLIRMAGGVYALEDATEKSWPSNAGETIEEVAPPGGSETPNEDESVNAGDTRKQSHNTSIFMNLQMEDFYTLAHNCDVLIYNGTIGDDLSSLRELKAINPLFSDFSAIQTGNVWCQNGDLFQHPTALAQALRELKQALESANGSRTAENVPADDDMDNSRTAENRPADDDMDSSRTEENVPADDDMDNSRTAETSFIWKKLN